MAKTQKQAAQKQKGPKQARQVESVTQRDERLESERRAEAHSRAHDAAPLSAGNELLEGSPERKAKQDEAKAEGSHSARR